MLLSLFTADRLPKKPYCSNNKTASLIRDVATALSYAYIQPNPPGLLYWLVFDIDRDDAKYRFENVIAPAPNIIVANPENGHAHYYYALKTPVNTGKNGRAWPRNYAEAIYCGLGAILDADPSYVRLISKTPFFPGHISFSPRAEAYELGELDEYIVNRAAGLIWKADARARGRIVNDDGRNCTLFDNLRRWAYSWVNTYRQNCVAVEVWYEVCRKQAEEMNDFRGHPKGPLTASELKATAKSVARWAWNKYDGSSGNDPDFVVLQAARGRRKGLSKRNELMPLAHAMVLEGHTQREIAQQLSVAQKTVSNWLKRRP